MFAKELIQRIVSEANLAPSTHNTQPARWSFTNDSSILISADCSRFLPAGDPTNRDAGLSCGAAVEGTVMALAEVGIKVSSIDDLWANNDCDTIKGHRLAAQINIKGEALALPLNGEISKRFTWRSKFLSCENTMTQALDKWASEKSDVILATSTTDIDFLSQKNDKSSLHFMRDNAFRNELVDWMRLSTSHHKYAEDGLNLEALQMGALEGFGAKLVLGTSLFGALDKVGFAKVLVGEEAQTKSASAIALFHRPLEESPIDTGRAFYRFWLEMTALGFSAWPMAVVADNEESAAECMERFSIPQEHRLINVLRVGKAGKKRPKTARLNVENLVV